MVHFTEGAQTRLVAFRQQCREWESQTEGLMPSIIGKLPGLSVRLPLVLALLDWAAEGDGPPHYTTRKRKRR